ncbi:uncharacterized protein VICG_00723 [Vittaforma corneae ATCC 50505]|uniref:C2H2-type domain-containing protein n=1 Tax=Vittaforma corneae (strain ATCC 50505) TaxID=993615 RepID=L2GN48_VITCO|nr:uncharacterized protein VICG_00723 [Vittaforma corneae ATCC 50505]ELA42323.1 hypothetical protein VICG_00723 [Vittaforma corneae ATCC 50505]
MARKATRKHKKGHSKKQYAKRVLQIRGMRPLDQIQESISRGKLIEGVEELPAGGNYSCLKCDVYFRDQNTLEQHFKTKAHKKRIKEFGIKQHTSKDAEMAAGLF